ncbi:hypothetical protein F4781DRAFT_115424 [Annulohypoxylon bovei var. microspora]|nr:hypothetical protein F4781DRAFT_115424 [Annulohypoxylon bovei var. microspora]
MAGRRRPVTRRTESVEPIGGHVTRQTRQSARRPEASIELESQQQTETPRSGPSRRRRKSLENVAADSSPKSATNHASPELGNLGLLQVTEPMSPHDGPLFEMEDVHEPPEMEADRIQDMLDFDIPKLTRWTDKLYGILLSLDDNKPNVDDWTKLTSYRKSYSHARLPFANNSMPFIKPINLSEEYDQAVRSKIQIAIYSGNLVSLLTSLADVGFRKANPSSILKQLDDAFPSLFVPRPHIGSHDIELVFDLAFRIRYNILLGSWASITDNESLEGYLTLVASVFCGQTIGDVGNAREALDKGPYRSLAGMEINEDSVLYKTYCERIQSLTSSQTFNDKFRSRAFRSLYTEIFADIRSWALEMYQQLNKPGDQNNTQSTNGNLGPRLLTEHTESDSLFVDNGDEAGDDSDSASDTDVGGYNQLPLHGSNENYINSSAALAAVRRSEEKASMRPAEGSPLNQQTAKGKGKASDTRDAIRLLEPGQVLGRTRKRLRPNRDSDNEDDGDDFEVNEQLLGESKRVLNEHASVQRSSPMRPRLSKQPQASNSQGLSPMASSRRISSAQPVDDLQDDYNLQDRDILVLSQSARNIRQANYSNKPRQIRTPWSAYDTSRLVDLIADPSFGCSWSAMEKAGGFEHARNQQALRDKARSLKVWYLEGDRILPPGFDQIALGQKEKDAVIKCGRNPDRREDDLDEDGQVTDNIWVG